MLKTKSDHIGVRKAISKADASHHGCTKVNVVHVVNISQELFENLCKEERYNEDYVLNYALYQSVWEFCNKYIVRLFSKCTGILSIRT